MEKSMYAETKALYKNAIGGGQAPIPKFGYSKINLPFYKNAIGGSGDVPIPAPFGYGNSPYSRYKNADGGMKFSYADGSVDQTLLNRLKSELADLYTKRDKQQEWNNTYQRWYDEAGSDTAKKEYITKTYINVGKEAMDKIKVDVSAKETLVNAEQDRVTSLLREKAKTDPNALAALKEIELGKVASAASTKKILIIGVSAIVLIGITIFAIKKIKKS